MKKENESVKKLEIGKDYVNPHNNIIVIDRVGDHKNRGFKGEEYEIHFSCWNHSNWREATKGEVIEAFEKHLLHRYGKDWRTMKIKERHPVSSSTINHGRWNVEFSKLFDGWNVWNRNGLLYCDGIWAERLEAPAEVTQWTPAPEDIEEVKKEKASVKELEIGKDYIRKYGDIIVIDRKGSYDNNGFVDGRFGDYIACFLPNDWREATEQEVIEAFKKHLVYRYGEDWRTMRIKKKDSHQRAYVNDGSWDVGISQDFDGWNVYNENGVLYCDGVWAERLEEEPKNSSEWTPAPEAIKPSETQIGGNHYSNMEIQPVEFIHKNGLSFIQGNIIKYVCRYKDKGGIEDLQKAKHCIDLLIEFEEENN